MSSLVEKFRELETLLLTQRHTLALHAGVPFVLLIYDPNQERLCRDEQAHLATKLQDAGLTVHDIPVQSFIFDHYERIGLLDKALDLEHTRPAAVYSDFARHYRPALVRHITKTAADLEGQDAVLFLTQVAHLYPFVRVSNLLEDLENKVKLPFVIFYPGQELDGELRFLGLENADGPHSKYRARRI